MSLAFWRSATKITASGSPWLQTKSPPTWSAPHVLLSGPSGSGKTTTALKIEEELQRRGVNSHAVAMDNYFKTLNHKTAPRTPEGDIDYESPLCMDMELLDQHFTALSKGEEVIIPKFEFVRQMRNDSRGTPLRLGKNEIAIFEGIHAAE